MSTVLLALHLTNSVRGKLIYLFRRKDENKNKTRFNDDLSELLSKILNTMSKLGIYHRWLRWTGWRRSTEITHLKISNTSFCRRNHLKGVEIENNIKSLAKKTGFKTYFEYCSNKFKKKRVEGGGGFLETQTLGQNLNNQPTNQPLNLYCIQALITGCKISKKTTKVTYISYVRNKSGRPRM